MNAAIRFFSPRGTCFPTSAPMARKGLTLLLQPPGPPVEDTCNPGPRQR